VTRTYDPVTYTQTAISVDIYSADKGQPLSVEDENAVPECIVEVRIPSYGSEGRYVKVSFAFGEAELRVTQECEATGALYLLAVSALDQTHTLQKVMCRRAT